VLGQVEFQRVIPPNQAFPKDPAKTAEPHVLVPDWAGAKAFPLTPSPAFGSRDVKEAILRRGENGHYEIELVLTMAAATRFGTFTGANQGAVIAILVDRRVVTAFAVRGRNDAGRIKISGADDPVTQSWYRAIVGQAGKG